MARRRQRRDPEEWEPAGPPAGSAGRCPALPAYADEEVQKEAEQLVDDSGNIPNFAYFGELDLGKTWAYVMSVHRDSGLLDQSNHEAVKEDLRSRFPNDVADEESSHWAVGWIRHLAVRMLDRRGCVTPAGAAAVKWLSDLRDYPVADEEDYLRRESEATHENIKSEGGITDDEAWAVEDWLSNNNPGSIENRDDQGGYPSSEEIQEALEALGLRQPEREEGEPEGPEEPPRFEDPAQTRIRFPE